MPGRLQSLIALHQEVENHAVSFCYRGPFLDRFTNTILDIYDAALRERQNQPAVNRKVSFLLVECFQNILRHGETGIGVDMEFNDDGLFSFRSSGDEFIINSINLVRQEEVAYLKGLVDTINSLDGQKLKELYLNQLNVNSISEKGGAGLGLIELARKSGREVLYEFEQAPGGMSWFHQQITFTLLSKDLPIRNCIRDTRELYARMAEENTLLYYKGDFSQKSILPLLELVEHNMNGNVRMSSRGRRTGHVLVEILQNISKHSRSRTDRPEGIFTVGWREGRIVLQTGNEVDDTEKAFLSEKLSYLQDLNPAELLALHKTALRSSLKFENKQKSGLGLIEVARASCAPIQYLFKTLEKENHLFALQVCI